MMAASRTRRKAAPRRWHVAPPPEPSAAAAAEELRRALRVSAVCARILVRRGYTQTGDAKAFLSRNLDLLHEPHLLPDMDRAVARIAEAVEKNQKVVLFGDYDADGLTATALLDRFFGLVKSREHTGVQVESLVPERKHGYGLSAEAATAIKHHKPDLLITLDNGISAHGPLDTLAHAGTECIVVDHHHIGANLPRAVAVINPKRRDGGCNYPFTDLCGAGIAFKLAWALAVHFSHNRTVTKEFRAFLLDAVALAGIGTLADVVPLVGENRVLAHQGLLALQRTRAPGLRALMGLCAIRGTPRVSDVTFRIAPRLNAAGRCGEVTAALELLLTADPARADDLATLLDGYNAERQDIESRILEEARQQALDVLERKPDCCAFVLESADWHDGVIGIVASRIVEEFHRPALLLSVDRGSKVARGSGRSIRGLRGTGNAERSGCGPVQGPGGVGAVRHREPAAAAGGVWRFDQQSAAVDGQG
ncbi:MAG: DHH family phosphoesterase [Planctomycetota bacterium]|nr:DHH family phosphoesterase [Planctomycetota bacterium]